MIFFFFSFFFLGGKRRYPNIFKHLTISNSNCMASQKMYIATLIKFSRLSLSRKTWLIIALIILLLLHCSCHHTGYYQFIYCLFFSTTKKKKKKPIIALFLFLNKFSYLWLICDFTFHSLFWGRRYVILFKDNGYQIYNHQWSAYFSVKHSKWVLIWIDIVLPENQSLTAKCWPSLVNFPP